MTQSPMSSQPSPNGASNPSLNSESLDWELRMAKLVGLEEKYQTPDNSPTESNDSQPAIDDEPQAVQTQQQLSSNPFAKAALVGTGTLIMVMFAGIFLTQVMSGGAKKPKVQTLAPEVKPQPTAKPRVQQLETEVETLKTKLALAEQAKDVKAAQQQLRRLRNKPSTPTVTQSPSAKRQQVASVKTPTPVRTVKTPTPVRTVYREVERVVRVPQPQTTTAPLPSPSTFPPNNQPPIVTIPPNPPSSSPTPPNPLQEWSRLAKLGSYGEVSGKQESRVSNSSFDPPPTPERNIDIKRPPTIQPRDRTRPTLSTVSRRTGKSTVIGTSAKAVLATAISGQTTSTRTRLRSRRRNSQTSVNNTDNVDNEVFVVRLKEPLKTQDNDIALPKDTELLVKVDSFSREGLTKLKVTRVLIPEKNKVRERTLSRNELAIRGVNGKPLIAKKYRKGSSSTALNDAGLFVLGGVGKAAEIINRPESNVTTTANNTTITSSDRNRDLLAGIFEGGVRTVVPQVRRRNTRRTSTRARNRRTNIWFLPVGTEVEVFVNQRVRF
ncbi:MAG: TrbI/VirB10 family protein [Calothrix sp. MO_167.B12]|nr:TrbI/VirB10 family protein [Calothrix sp. MO_167.B12]